MNKIKNKDLYAIVRGIDNCKNLPGKKFAYALARNRKKIASEIETIESTLEKFPDCLAEDLQLKYKEFSKENRDISRKFAKKNDKGVIQMDNGRHIIEDSDKYMQALEELEGKYKELTDVMKTHEEKNKELLESEISFGFYKISFDEVPESITPTQLSPIIDIVDEEKPLKIIEPKSN